jgi:23S rRNA (cytosine1962-C5)-methyltransferase
MARAEPPLPPTLLLADDWADYALLDSGDGQKLERYGPVTVVRPDAQALWPRRLGPADWAKADAEFSGAEGEEMGRWRFTRRVPESWPMAWNGIGFRARCTPFRHLGVFPEHSVHWRWAQGLIGPRAAKGAGPEVLNLFGYTGMASLACAAAGAKVTHLDASKKAIGYGRENQSAAGLENAPIRWICDDALDFAEREARRGRRYDGIILDPPKHGRGPDGQVFKLEEGLGPLLASCAGLLSDKPLFLIATVYAVRLSYLALSQSLDAALAPRAGVMEAGDMAIPEGDGARALPTAIFARWRGA